jgi:flagellar FliL protein
MAITPADPTTTDAKPAKAKGGGAGKTILIVLAATIGAAAGGFGAVIAAGSLGFGGGGGGHVKQAAAAAATAVEYIEVDQAFTSNLSDTGRYLQVRLSLSHRGGGAVTAAVARHKPALVSAILGTLGEATEADVGSRDAKDLLRSRLKQVINETLRQNGTAEAIDNVFFTSLVVQ